MSKPPVVTYMRKKSRTLKQEDVNKDSYMPTVSKRSRAQSSAYKAPNNIKKLKTSMIENLQTPYPTALSESQAFRLKSSRGHPLPPDHEFSPVPPAPKSIFNSNSSTTSSLHAYMKRSTRFLKENRSSGNVSQSCSAARSRSQVRDFALGATQLGLRNDMSATGRARNDLASPFSSRPSSPVAFSDNDAADNLVRDAVPRERLPSVDATSPTRSLWSSPAHSDEPMAILSARRPSAPTTSRPKLHHWTRLLPQVSGSTCQESTKNKSESTSLFPLALELSTKYLEPTSKFATSSQREKWTWSDAAVDFNRPPSQLSFHSDLFEDAQGASTPLRDIKHRQQSNYLTDDQEIDRINQPTLCSFFSDDDESSTVTTSMNSWISDSLISPPSIYRSRKRKYRLEWCGRNEDVYSDEDEDEDHIFDRSNDGAGVLTHVLSTGIQTKHDGIHNSASHVHDLTAAEIPEENRLVLCAQNLSIIDVLGPSDLPSTDDAASKTSSSDVSEQVSGVKSHPQGRKRRGTIRAAEITSQPQKTTQARRNRSGTIVGPAATRRTRSGTIIGPAPQSRGIHGGTRGKSTTSALSDEGNRGTVNVDGICDEDELDSFKNEWVDEPWTVADPPSPATSRSRKGMRSARAGKVQLVHKRMTDKQPQFGLQEHITEHIEGESDDELLLK